MILPPLVFPAYILRFIVEGTTTLLFGHTMDTDALSKLKMFQLSMSRKSFNAILQKLIWIHLTRYVIY